MEIALGLLSSVGYMFVASVSGLLCFYGVGVVGEKAVVAVMRHFR